MTTYAVFQQLPPTEPRNRMRVFNPLNPPIYRANLVQIGQVDAHDAKQAIIAARSQYPEFRHAKGLAKFPVVQNLDYDEQLDRQADHEFWESTGALQ